MEEITFENGVETALSSLLNNRLALLAGAGLSMAPPSCLPSAAELAAAAKHRYDSIYGDTQAPLAEGIEDQAEFFLDRGELDTVFFRTLIGYHVFSSGPNPGHFAVADLLLVNAIQTAVTTNVDTLIETAGEHLYGAVCAGIDGHDVAQFPQNISPLLKIHGCRRQDWSNMVWAPGQLKSDPVKSRISKSAAWLNARLLDRDLLIIGFSTDWDYLNEILSDTLGTVKPAHAIVVGPSDADTFEGKAPELFALGERATGSFEYVQASGSEFLAALRRAFSKSFVRRVLHSGQNDYKALMAADPDSSWMEPPIDDNQTLWQIRRDLEGCTPNSPATENHPNPNETLVGLTLLQLRGAGAVPDGQYWILDGQRIRVLRANRLLHQVEQVFSFEVAPAISPDLVIAVGAEETQLPANIARPKPDSTITRGNKARWMTRPRAIEELGLC